MISTVALVFIENAFFSWLFDVAPQGAFIIFVGWLLLTGVVKYTKIEGRIELIESRIETRFVAIESRLGALESRIDSVEKTVASIDTRLGKVEGQLEIVIDLLKNKK